MLVWLVTGAASGIGAALVQEIVRRGDKVIAANRQAEQMSHIASDSVSLLEFDLTSGSEVINEKIKEAWAVYGHIDVLVNNAGTFGVGPFEDTTERFEQRMFQVNVFGHMHATRAILPYFREQGSGCITFTSSNQIWGNMPYTLHYNMTKAAITSLAESLHKEVSPLGIRCVAFECGGAATPLFAPRDKDKHRAATDKESIEAYKPGFAEISSTLAEWGTPPGDAAKMASATVDVVKGENQAAGRTWSSRIALGSDALAWARLKRQQETLVMDRWEDVSASTDRDGVVLSKALDRWILMPGAA